MRFQGPLNFNFWGSEVEGGGSFCRLTFCVISESAVCLLVILFGPEALLQEGKQRWPRVCGVMAPGETSLNPSAYPRWPSKAGMTQLKIPGVDEPKGDYTPEDRCQEQEAWPQLSRPTPEPRFRRP